MVSYCNSLAMYRHQQQAPGWYQSYQAHAHPVHPQQYLSCVQDQQASIPSWHHPPPPPHPVFQPGDWSPSSTPDYMHHHHHHHHQTHPLHPDHNADPILPSPPMTVSGSDMSSPSGGGTVTPPQNSGPHGGAGPGTPLGPLGPLGTPRPLPARSPFEWMKKPSYQSQPNPGKTRTKDKYRVVYSDHQRLELEKEFHYSRYITIRRKAELAASLGLSERQVKIWFQNRRAKERKQTKKREELDHKVKIEDLQPHGVHGVQSSMQGLSSGLPHHGVHGVQGQQQSGHQGLPHPHHGQHHHHHHHALHHQLHHQLHHHSLPGSTSPLGGHVHHHMLSSAGGGAASGQLTPNGGGSGGSGGSTASGPLSSSASSSSGSSGPAGASASSSGGGSGSGGIM